MSILSEILDATRARVAEAKTKVGDEALEQRIASIDPAKDFTGSLRARRPAIIAEIKRRTPSRGPLNLDLDAARMAAAYAEGGAAAISVLTEPDFFEGSVEDLQAARVAGLPVLRKDFVVDHYQVLESRAVGADAVLIIVRILGDELDSLVAASRAWGMEPLVEVHDESDLERALDADARVIGINHRDLDTFDVDPDRTAKLAPLVPEGTTAVALSGVSTRAEIEDLVAAGASAVLIGETLVTASDPAGRLRELLGR